MCRQLHVQIGFVSIVNGQDTTVTVNSGYSVKIAFCMPGCACRNSINVFAAAIGSIKSACLHTDAMIGYMLEVVIGTLKLLSVPRNHVLFCSLPNVSDAPGGQKHNRFPHLRPRVPKP